MGQNINADGSATVDDGAATIEAPAAPPQLPDSLPRARLQKLVTDMGKIVSDHGIDTAEYVTIGGVRQWITIRGQDQRQPILLYLHGGPGGALSHWSFVFQRPWEEYFTVVNWDQRGFGKSNIDGDALKGTLNKDQLVSDAIELIDYLRTRFGRDRIVLVGQSWGSLLGLEVAKRAPDRLFVLATIGQATAWEGMFEYTKQSLIDLARETGDTDLEAAMIATGPFPPIEDEAARAMWIGTVQMAMGVRGYSYHNGAGPEGFGDRFETMLFMSPDVDNDRFAAMVSDTTAGDRVKEMTASIAGWSAAKDIGSIEVPYVIFQGTYDWQTPTGLARIWFEQADAPWKLWIEMPNSGHFVAPEEPGRMIVELHNKVLPATRGEIPAGAILRGE